MSVELLHATDDALVNETLRLVIATFEAVFPQRTHGYYVQGSYAERSEVVASDLDLVVLFAAKLNQGERVKARQLAQTLVSDSTIELDIEIAAEDEIERGVDPNLKLGSVLVYGQALRDDLPLTPIEGWTSDRMHSSYWRVARLFTRPEIITCPLAHPDPGGEFYGYDRRVARLRDGRQVPCTRDLIRLTGWAATARLAYERGVYVARKSECHTLYREHIGDEWASLLDDIYTLCRGKWSYLIPEAPEERERLRGLCARTLDFENAFLLVYTRYLITELHRDDTAAAAALRVLALAPYRDAAVIEALESLTQRDNDHLRTTARAILDKLLAAEEA